MLCLVCKLARVGCQQSCMCVFQRDISANKCHHPGVSMSSVQCTASAVDQTSQLDYMSAAHKLLVWDCSPVIKDRVMDAMFNLPRMQLSAEGLPGTPTNLQVHSLIHAILSREAAALLASSCLIWHKQILKILYPVHAAAETDICHFCALSAMVLLQGKFTIEPPGLHCPV